MEEKKKGFLSNLRSNVQGAIAAAEKHREESYAKRLEQNEKYVKLAESEAKKYAALQKLEAKKAAIRKIQTQNQNNVFGGNMGYGIFGGPQIGGFNNAPINAQVKKIKRRVVKRSAPQSYTFTFTPDRRR